uniref:Uncharacterized protein n=1 Tax=viral metagenome TaxID=1070528 RepID=A0A6M3X8T7_9ZZZZ
MNYTCCRFKCSCGEIHNAGWYICKGDDEMSIDEYWYECSDCGLTSNNYDDIKFHECIGVNE